MAQAKSAARKPRRKEKKNIALGQAHIKSTFNNTIVSITDPSGAVISWASSGGVGFKGSRKSTPYAAGMAAESAARQAQEHGVKKVDVFVKGPGAVVAADIAPPAGVEVHNPDLHIATLNDKGKLEMELVVERGRGYVSATLNKQPGQEIGRIPVDSIYSPVLKVTYKVEATRVEQRTDFDKLVLDVETKPSMLPRDAVASAGKTLVELFGLARELNVDAEGIDIGPSPADAFVAEQLSTPIEQLDLTVRSYNCLKREGIHTVGELIGRSEADLLDIRNFGAKSIDEVKVKLVTLGLALKDSPPGFDPGAAVYFSDEDDDDDLGYVEDEQL